MNVELGILAWGIGGIVGFGMEFGTGKHASVTTGVLAAIIAMLAVGAGKHLSVSMQASKYASEVEMHTVTEHDVQLSLADEVAVEYEEAGKQMYWPTGMTYEDAYEQAHYPADVWQEMERRWSDINQAERDSMVETVQGYADEQSAEIREYINSEGVMEMFISSFGLFDLLWVALAVGTAFSIGKSNVVG